jgi:hypothetical protein
MFYVAEFGLLLAALLYMEREDKGKFLFLAKWILIVPLASMLLLDTHGLRNSLMIPPMILLSSYSLTRIPKKVMYVAVLLFAIQLVHITQVTYFLAPNKFTEFWAGPARDASLLAISRASAYDEIIISDKIDSIEYAYPVYAKVDPLRVIEQFGAVRGLLPPPPEWDLPLCAPPRP